MNIQEILSKIPITEKTKAFVRDMWPNRGNLIWVEKKRKEDDPDVVGWGKLANGTIIYLKGDLRIRTGKPKMVPLEIIEVPSIMLK
tara:strand:- start:4980 stop:5237 length:258 start_codon:yes stop_codon:yes gene_type:complete